MIQIGAFTNKPDGAVSLYRGHGPFSKMRKHCDFIELPLTVSWDQISKFDVLFFSKPCTPEAVAIAETAKNLGIPIWLDFDDDVFSIEPSNTGPYLLYSRPDTMECVQEMIKASTVITVSTKAILERLKPFEKNVVLIENADMHSLVPEIDTKRIHRRNRFALWRGGESHKYAIQAHELCVSKMLDERPDLTMLWVGNWPSCLLETHKGRNLLEPGKAWFEYFKMLGERRPLFQIVFLNNCEFDHAKSHNAWLESIMLGGSVCFAPEGFDEFTGRPGVIHYTKETLVNVVHKFMELDEAQISEVVNEAKEFIQKTYSLDLMNQKRLRVLQFLRP
jgi:hypothetical protein